MIFSVGYRVFNDLLQHGDSWNICHINSCNILWTPSIAFDILGMWNRFLSITLQEMRMKDDSQFHVIKTTSLTPIGWLWHDSAFASCWLKRRHRKVCAQGWPVGEWGWQPVIEEKLYNQNIWFSENYIIKIYKFIIIYTEISSALFYFRFYFF